MNWLRRWSTINNPRLHVDCLRIAQLMPQQNVEAINLFLPWIHRGGLHYKTTRLVGDRGCLRFPSAYLSAVDYLLTCGEREVASKLLREFMTTLDENLDSNNFNEQLHFALLGAPELSQVVGKEISDLYSSKQRRK